MSKPIRFNSILTNVSTKSDGSLSLRLSTPEFTAEETTVLLKLCRINLDCTLTPLNQELDAPLEVKAEVETKTPSQRLRAVLFVLYKTENKAEPFEVFYANRIEKIIDW